MTLLRYRISVYGIWAAGAALVLLATTSTRVWADSVGASPTAYTSPFAQAQNEQAAFQRLQRLRDTGRISLADYQREIMGLAEGNKVGMHHDQQISSTPPDIIEMPISPTVALMPTTPSGPPKGSPTPSFTRDTLQLPPPPAPAPVKHTPKPKVADVIQRPIGQVVSVVVREATE
jgi:hypothetical protein